MRIITPNEDNLIFLGKVGENEAVQVVLDVSEILSAFGDGGNFVLTNMRSEDTLGYPVIVTRDGSSVVWTVQSIDLAYAGEGKLEVTYYLGDTIAKSITYPTYVCASVTGGAEPPDPWKPIIDEILQARDEAVEAAGNAAHSESNAAESERNASASEQAASQSESNAHDSELAAAGSSSSAETSALKSEGYAVGKQNGTPVESGSPYYENNAKFYAEQAGELVAPFTAHLTDTDNPHSVTKEQVGLGNVDNTSDLNKPISTVTQTALDTKADKVASAVANDLAMLTADGNLADSGISADYLVPIKAKSGSVIEFNSDASVPLKSATLKGKTAAVNQQFIATARTHSSGVVFSVNADGYAVMNGTAASSDSTAGLLGSGRDTINGHTYLVKGGTTSQIVKGRLGSSGTYVEITDGLIFSGNGDNFGFVTAIVQGTTYNNVVVPVNIIDLTLCGFTSAETADVATLKAAWLAKYGVPLPQYIPYNAGSIVSNNATYQLTGRNLFDDTGLTWVEGKYLGATGVVTINANYKYSTTKLPILPSTEYAFQITKTDTAETIIGIAFFDENNNFISRSSSSGTAALGVQTIIFTTPTNAATYCIAATSRYGTTRIELELGDTVHNYEPYHNGGTIVADSLNGIGTVQDEQDKGGNITRRFGVVDLGSLTWAYTSGAFYTADLVGVIQKPASSSVLGNYLCGRLVQKTGTDAWGTYQYNVAQNSNLWAKTDGASTDAAAFKTAMSGVYLVYELATPTTDTTTATTLITQKGYNILRTVDGDIQNAPADIEYLNGLAAVIAEALQ